MLNQNDRKKIFEEVRIITYCAIILSGILSCTIPFHYLCDLDGYACPFCGIRHAIDYVLELDFINAYQSNHLIVVIISTAILITADCVYILFKRAKNARKNNKKAE